MDFYIQLQDYIKKFPVKGHLKNHSCKPQSQGTRHNKEVEMGFSSPVTSQISKEVILLHVPCDIELKISSILNADCDLE